MVSDYVNNCGGGSMIFGTGLSSAKSFPELYALIKKAIECGICSIDTAPSYNTEIVVGEVIKALIADDCITRRDVFVQDKIDAWQMQVSNGAVDQYIYDALSKMSLTYFDCVFIHWPLPEYRDQSLRCLFNLKKAGVIRNVGVCNVQMRQLKQLAERGLLPDYIQIERNPLRICSEETAFCLSRGIYLQSYSPLCKYCDEIKNSEVLKRLSNFYKKSIGQIVMRWQIDTGYIPVFSTKNVGRIDEYAAVDSFSLTDEDINAINTMNRNYKMYLESISCPGF